MTKGNWKDVGGIADIPAEGARVVTTSLGDVAVFLAKDGSVYAIEDRCPHLGGPLSQGIVHGAFVTCPLHNWVIDLSSGGVVGPDEGCVKTLGVEVKDGRVLVDFSALLEKAA